MGSLPWDMIGAIIGGVSFLLTLLVEWNKLGTWRRIIIALVIGAVAFFIVVLVAPLLFPPSGGTPTATPTAITNSDFLFSENFEDNSADGFINKVGLWMVVSETGGNKVLDVNSMDSSVEYPTIQFGEASWKDFIFETRVNMVDYSLSSEAPLTSIVFRGNYKVAFTPYWKGFDLVYEQPEPPWISIAGRTRETQKNTWYTVRIEAKDSQVNVFLDDKLTISETLPFEKSGPFGFATWPKVHIQFDDIKIQPIDK